MLSFRCTNCKNYIGDYICEAFTDRIPDSIFLGENDHKEPLEDQDNNIVFEPIEKE